jgi:hypothetical protein
MTQLFEYDGFGFPAIWNGAYDSIESKIALDGLSSTGANSVSLTSTAFVSDLHSNTISLSPTSTESDENLMVAMRDAEARGLTVMFKPHLVPVSNEWIGDLAPTDVATFFRNYKAYIVNQATVAEHGHASVFVIGNEMNSLVGDAYKPYWDDIIKSVREVYDGKLTYASDWHRPDLVSFWDELDFVGVNAYVQLTEKDNPSVADLVKAWTTPSEYDYVKWGWNGKSAEQYYTDLAAKVGKPLMFTELGYNSGENAASDPANWYNPGASDQGLQAKLYQAFLDVWSKHTSDLSGVFMWNWSTLADPKTTDSNWASDLTIQGKPAQQVIESYYNHDNVAQSVIQLHVTSDKYGADAHFKLYADGVYVGDGNVGSDFSKGQSETFSFKSDGQPKTISVVYDNDVYGGAGKDRNLYVDWVEVNGARLEGEAAASNNAYCGTSRAFFDQIRMGKMNVGGEMTFNVKDADPAKSTITAHISGTAFQGNPIYYIVADGRIVGTGEVTANFTKNQWMDVSVTGSFGGDGPSQVQVYFGNDLWKASGQDRNMYVDYISVNGVYYRGENATNTADGGDHKVNASMGMGVMAENGALTFNTQAAGPLDDRVVLRMAGDSFKGDAHFWLVVDGTKVESGTISAQKSTNQLQDFVFHGDYGITAHSKVQVVYDNDYGDKGGDRNMYVDYMSINGSKYEAEDASTAAYTGSTAWFQGLHMSKMNVNGALTFDLAKLAVSKAAVVTGTLVSTVVHGSVADDALYADSAAKMTGGEGSDSFVFSTKSLGGSEIMDFNVADHDQIVLSGFGSHDNAVLTSTNNHLDYTLTTTAGTFHFEAHSTAALTLNDILMV